MAGQTLKVLLRYCSREWICAAPDVSPEPQSPQTGFAARQQLTPSFPSCFLQVYPNYVPGDPEPEAEGTPAAFLLGYDVRICRRKHAAPPGNVPRERPSTGATALHNDPKEPCRNITM